MRRPADDRFRAKYVEDKPDECWVWTGARNKDGYGSFWGGEYIDGVPGHGPVMVLAHRWAYVNFVGPIPEGQNVLHHCDNPPCVNPSHFFLGSQADNIADCAAKGRRNQTRYKKLSAEIHETIRALYAQGDVSQSELARRFGVSQGAVGRIVRQTEGYVALTPAERGRRRVDLSERALL